MGRKSRNTQKSKSSVDSMIIHNKELQPQPPPHIRMNAGSSPHALPWYIRWKRILSLIMIHFISTIGLILIAIIFEENLKDISETYPLVYGLFLRYMEISLRIALVVLIVIVVYLIVLAKAIGLICDLVCCGWCCQCYGLDDYYKKNFRYTEEGNDSEVNKI